MLKLNFKSQYTKISTKTGQPKVIFRYAITGEPKELKAYVDSKVKEGAAKDSIDTKDGVIFYTDRFVPGRNISLNLTEKGRYFPDTTQQDQIRNLEQQGFSFEAACSMVRGTKVAEAE